MVGEVTPEALLERLRSVAYLGAETGRQMMEGIRQEVSRVEGVRDVRSERRLPVLGDRLAPPGRYMTPLQAELLEDGVVPQADGIGTALPRVGVAPEVGYGEGGPEPIPSPESIAPGDRYTGWPPVFQWEMDPADPSLETSEASVRLADWEYEVWSQVHPAGLVYVSIQAMDSDPASGPERQHPLGRNVVVNLVYDRRRAGVVAIYGTARDFRPFIEAFRIGCDLDDERPQAGKGESA